MEKVGEREDQMTRLRSVSALNTFYHEMQHEVAGLEQQVACKDAVIAELKARLARHERTREAPSTSLLDSLIKEICELKHKLKDTEVDASQRLEHSKRESQGLQQRLRDMEQELECMRHRPEHQKEREIQRLHASLAERDRVQATRDVLCSSLVEEVDQLRGQLGATVRVCQELLGRLEKSRTPGAEDNAHAVEVTEFSDVAHLNSLVSKLQRENQQLRDRVAYVENLNSKWQKYDQSREQYVKGLCEKLREPSGLAQAQGQATEALLQEEIGRLNGLLQEKMLQCERMSTERDEREPRDQERIQMLEQQVLAYIEDFKSERADRERAQGKILELQDDVERLQLQIHTQNAREATSARRLHISLKKPVRKQTDTAETLLRSSPADSSAKRTAGHWPAQDTAELQCPLCAARYDNKHTAEFLNHCEECAKL
ncbi:TNFAIP3-interacting protein 2 [Electrophorus electricus]|uniref:CCHC NOA-type domain-containing protein n=1 Tax=Electrophorus electricus TaxID=8005 RepID=A0AAY5EBB6_ELEEL|nr:TNFAIP3-interacting protein 2 [Electrophorus electricus]